MLSSSIVAAPASRQRTVMMELDGTLNCIKMRNAHTQAQAHAPTQALARDLSLMLPGDRQRNLRSQLKRRHLFRQLPSVGVSRANVILFIFIGKCQQGVA